MDRFARRPAAIFATAFFICSVMLTYSTGRQMSLSILLIALPLLFGAIFAICQNRRRSSADRRLAAAMLCLGVALAGIFSAIVYNVDVPPEEGECEVFGVVEEKLWGSGPYSAYLVKIDREDGGRFSALLEATDPTLLPGDEVTVCGEIVSVDAPDTADIERYLRSRGITAVLSAESVELLGTRRGAGVVIAELRGRISGRILSLVPGDAGGLVTALVTGDRSGLSDFLRLDFTRLGVAHLLAISGIHLSVVFSALILILSSSPLGKRWGSVITVPAILFYMAFCGFSPSVVRSGIMLIICALAAFIGRRRDPYSVLCVAVTFIALFDRHVFYDTGFLLSVTSVAGVLWFSALRPRYGGISSRSGNTGSQSGGTGSRFGGVLRRALTFILLTALSSVAVSLFTMPIIAMEFGMMSCAAPVANVIFIPLVTLLLYAIPFFVISLPFPALSVFMGKAIGAFAQLIISLARFMADRESLTFSVRYPFFAVLWFCAMAGAVIMLTKSRRRLGAAILALSCLGTVASTVGYEAWRRDSVTVSACSVSGGDMLCITSGSKVMLVDMSSGYSSALRRGLVLVEDKLITEVDVFILTHYHTRHISALRSLLGQVYVGKVCLPEPIGNEEREICIQLAELCAQRGVEAELIGDGIVLGDVTYVPGDRCWLSRSSEAVYSATIEAYGRQAAVISPGFYEVSDKFRSLSDFASAELFIYPAHGAKVRTPYDLPNGSVMLLGENGERFSDEGLGELRANGYPVLGEGDTVLWKKK